MQYFTKPGETDGIADDGKSLVGVIGGITKAHQMLLTSINNQLIFTVFLKHDHHFLRLAPYPCWTRRKAFNDTASHDNSGCGTTNGGYTPPPKTETTYIICNIGGCWNEVK